MFWLWKIYVNILMGLCQLGITEIAVGLPSPDGWLGCWPFDAEPWASRVYLRNFVNEEYGGFRDVVITDWDFARRLDYTWGNATYLCRIRRVKNGKTWNTKKKLRHMPCIENAPKNCPHIRRFLKHHYVDRLISMDKR